MTTQISKPRIGFIGLGVMGAPMATCLANAGFSLALYDVSPLLAEELSLVLPDAMACRNPAEVGRNSDIVVTMLPNGRVVNQVVTAEDGLLAGMAPGSLLLDTSSSEPWLTRETAVLLEKQGIEMVDAPVSGAQWGAQSAELVFMVGGSERNVERVRPLLDAMGRAVFHLGDLTCGHMMKCINNLITAMTLTATTEGLVIGKRHGLDPSVMTDVLNESTGMSWITHTHIHQRVISRRFDDPFKLELMLKDMGIAMGLAEQSGVEVPASRLGHKLWEQASAAMGPGASVSEFARWVEQTTDTAITANSH
ncbi:NAD-binding protein [Pseudomonas stutzeri]|uniref:6-phosphogluconate dehydrogenase n=1 Tax=Stutzerimonas stutzeri KOS6 TaxID=1218352 RepID=A0A061JRW4_STUST|nr:NAD(P)-dependent oxidoreductase [Stutzerimonas stutzeri]EWC42447.1 6-phosphogluconate dehydrogenase [Stutzerimonas stutzeri KOS6]MBK3870220.1 NAD-binding protein [Stutzerimonas stutzeri]